MVSSWRSYWRIRSVSQPICSRMDPRAGKSASGMCSEALLWKLLAGHLGRRAPKDLTAPRTWLTSCVRQPINACRERIKAMWAWLSSPRCLSGYKSFGSTLARRARFLRHRSGRFCACSGIDEPQFTGIGHKDLVAALLQEPANPGRVGSRFYGDAHGLLGVEAPSEGFGGGAQPALLHNASPPSWSMRHR